MSERETSEASPLRVSMTQTHHWHINYGFSASSHGLPGSQSSGMAQSLQLVRLPRRASLGRLKTNCFRDGEESENEMHLSTEILSSFLFGPLKGKEESDWWGEAGAHNVICIWAPTQTQKKTEKGEKTPAQKHSDPSIQEQFLCSTWPFYDQ